MAALIPIVVMGGCAPAYVPPPVPADHPANPAAVQAPYVRPQDELGVVVVQTTDAGAGHEDAAPVSLPDDAAMQLREVFTAYVAIGNALASDEIAGVAAHAQKLGSAMDALVDAEVPGHPHFWHERAGDVGTIQDQALAAPADLQAARTAYGALSDAFERIISATGVPTGFDRPVHRFACGMFEDVPRGGVWLQFGDVPRNPYFGTRMLSCHREQAPMPTGETDSHAQQVSEKQGQEEHQHELGGG